MNRLLCFVSRVEGLTHLVFQEVCQLLENFPENSRLNTLAENFNGGGVVVAINFAAHQSFNFFFVEQSQPVSSFHEWTGIDFVV
jgi:hypothetical protein